MDDETRSYLANTIGEEFGVPQQLRSRLTGESLSELRADAQALAKQLGIAPERERDGGGKFTGGAADMNRLIREKAGRA